jgi:hypothetical protein
LDKAERLREASGALLQLLLRLDEVVRTFTSPALTVTGLTFALLCGQTGCNIGVILISNIVWDKFLTKNGLREPIPVLFPRYTRSMHGHSPLVVATTAIRTTGSQCVCRQAN